MPRGLLFAGRGRKGLLELDQAPGHPRLGYACRRFVPVEQVGQDAQRAGDLGDVAAVDQDAEAVG